MEAPKRRPRNTDPKRESIINSAIQVFQAVGYESASMDHVAEVAQASKRTVYNHFASKDALLEAAIERCIAEQRDRKQFSFDPGKPVAEQLMDFALAHIAIVGTPERLGLAKLLMSVLLRDPAKVLAARATQESEPDPLEVWLAQADAAGVLNVPDPRIAAAVFVAFLEGGVNHPALFLGPADPVAAKPLLDELVAMFLARYRPDAAR